MSEKIIKKNSPYQCSIFNGARIIDIDDGAPEFGRDGGVPLRPIQGRDTLLDDREKELDFHREIRPPEFSRDGLKSHSISPSFQIEFRMRLSKFSIFDSCTKTNQGWILMSLRMELFLILALRHLQFQDSVIIWIFRNE